MYNYRQLLDTPTIPKRDFYNMLFFFFEYILGMPSPFLTILTLLVKLNYAFCQDIFQHKQKEPHCCSSFMKKD